ncbi:MAG: Uncharacterised protein [Rhodospirillaceae bacterium]|nr:MAG: Uncharacterised protein [Rhodospirillaceae bacterium]
MERQQAGLVDVDAHLRQLFPERALVSDGAAEVDPLLGAGDRILEGALSTADGAHAVVDAAGAEAALRDLEATPLAQQHVRRRHAHVLEQHFGVAVGGIVVAEDVQGALDRHPRGVARHQNHRLLLMTLGGDVGLAHENENLAAWVRRAGGPPLAAVDDVFVTLAANVGLDVGGIGRGHVRFGHREGRTYLPGQQRVEPLLLLLRRTVAHQNLHISRVRSRTVAGLGREVGAAHFLTKVCVFKIAEPSAELALRKPQVPEPALPCLGLKLLHDRRGNPAITLGSVLLLEGGFSGVDDLVHEGLKAFLQVFGFI